MGERKQEARQRIFLENPYDLETIFESLQIAAKDGKELIYMDRMVSHIRLDPCIDIINLNYNILRDMNLLELEPIQ